MPTKGTEENAERVQSRAEQNQTGGKIPKAAAERNMTKKTENKKQKEETPQNQREMKETSCKVNGKRNDYVAVGYIKENNQNEIEKRDRCFSSKATAKTARAEGVR